MVDDWMYTPFSLRVSVPNMTSFAKIKAVMRNQGIGPLQQNGATTAVSAMGVATAVAGGSY